MLALDGGFSPPCWVFLTRAAVQQTLTTGHYKDSMDRLMLGVAVGFRLGREVTPKMAASA